MPSAAGAQPEPHMVGPFSRAATARRPETGRFGADHKVTLLGDCNHPAIQDAVTGTAPREAKKTVDPVDAARCRFASTETARRSQILRPAIATFRRSLHEEA
jgi:hypothetical protein